MPTRTPKTKAAESAASPPEPIEVRFAGGNPTVDEYAALEAARATGRPVVVKKWAGAGPHAAA